MDTLLSLLVLLPSASTLEGFQRIFDDVKMHEHDAFWESRRQIILKTLVSCDFETKGKGFVTGRKEDEEEEGCILGFGLRAPLNRIRRINARN
jgi:hypothetical protein